MRKLIAGGVVLAALALTGCAASNSVPKAANPAASSTTPANAIPANPVPIIRQAGGTTTAVLGDTDVYGDRYASGDLSATIPGCFMSYATSGCRESVTVTTYATATAQTAGETRNAPTDDHAEIKGHLFDVMVSGVSTDGSTWVYPVSVSVIATRVHGTVQTS